MPSIPIHHRLPSTTTSTPLPTLFDTPNGLAILELQASINTDDTETNHHPNNAHDHDHDHDSPTAHAPTYETPIGKLTFPDYSPLSSPDDTKWMKRVYLYVGRYQRMSGEVKKLGKPIAVVRKVASPAATSTSTSTPTSTEATEGLEIVDVVRYKIAFKNRPEPVNDG